MPQGMSPSRAIALLDHQQVSTFLRDREIAEQRLMAGRCQGTVPRHRLPEACARAVRRGERIGSEAGKARTDGSDPTARATLGQDSTATASSEALSFKATSLKDGSSGDVSSEAASSADGSSEGVSPVELWPDSSPGTPDP